LEDEKVNTMAMVVFAMVRAGCQFTRRIFNGPFRGENMKFRIGRSVLLAACLLPLFPFMCLSHPHVFVESTLTMVFDKEGLAGIRVEWNFDEFFTSMIISDYDRNRNGKFESPEVAAIEKKAFSNLLNFDYFTFIRIDGRPFEVRYVRDFSAILTGGNLKYEFHIPCHVRAISKFKEFIISQYDPTYYTSVTLATDLPVRTEGDSGFEVSHRLAKNRKEAYYFGQVYPVEVILRFRLKYG